MSYFNPNAALSLKRPEALLFDWDNTLVDSWGAIHTAFNLTLAQMGHVPWSPAQSRSRIGRSLRDTFPVIFGDDKWPEARKTYYKHFSTIHLERLAALPAAGELLETVRGTGVYTALVSNKSGSYLRQELAHIGWEKYFNTAIGAGDAASDKPSAEPVFLALAGSGIAASPSVWFIGDSQVDIDTARAAQCTAVLIGPEATGKDAQQGQEEQTEADLHLKDCRDLATLVKRLWHT